MVAERFEGNELKILQTARVVPSNDDRLFGESYLDPGNVEVTFRAGCPRRQRLHVYA